MKQKEEQADSEVQENKNVFLYMRKGTVKNLFYSPCYVKGIGKRLQNEETEPKPLVSGYPKAYVCTSRGEVCSM